MFRSQPVRCGPRSPRLLLGGRAKNRLDLLMKISGGMPGVSPAVSLGTTFAEIARVPGPENRRPADCALIAYLAPLAGGGRVKGAAAKRAAKPTLDSPEHGYTFEVREQGALPEQHWSAGGSLVPGDPADTGTLRHRRRQPGERCRDRRRRRALPTPRRTLPTQACCSPCDCGALPGHVEACPSNLGACSLQAGGARAPRGRRATHCEPPRESSNAAYRAGERAPSRLSPTRTRGERTDRAGLATGEALTYVRAGFREVTLRSSSPPPPNA